MSKSDIIVATAWQTAEPVASLAADKGNKFYLIQHHEIWDGPEDEVNRTWRLPLRKIVIARWLQDLGTALGASNMRHIPNGVDLKRFRVTNAPENRQMSILSLYHKAAFKGVPDALTALRQYHERYPEVPISLFGTSPRTSEIPDWVRYFENPTQRALVHDIYNQHSVYLGASLGEGWGLPPCEAMACGCAFVGTDIGGFREYARHGETALLSAPGEPNGLLENLIRITEDQTIRRHIQQSGTEYVQRFTWEVAARSLEKYFIESPELSPDPMPASITTL
jgi:glycosyltransferase involved in cell wall biosynthesis